MTLFTLLLIMAVERVTVKPKKFHITALSNHYFDFAERFKAVKSIGDKFYAQLLLILLIAGIPTGLTFLLVLQLPGIIVFIIHLLVLWVCLGCPVTRNTYRRYIQSANRDDFEACSLYSEQLGVTDGELSKVGKQLVLINYRQYASVIIFYVFFSVAGVVFYSICKEWFLRRQRNLMLKQDDKTIIDHGSNQQKTIAVNEVENQIDSLQTNDNTQTETSVGEPKFSEDMARKVLHVVDWIPVRLTAFGFLLVGHFSKGLPTWLSVVLDFNKSTYQILSKVAKASEEPEPYVKPVLQEPLQMVKLVKRNTVFLLVAISIMTLVGFLG